MIVVFGPTFILKHPSRVPFELTGCRNSTDNRSRFTYLIGHSSFTSYTYQISETIHFWLSLSLAFILVPTDLTPTFGGTASSVCVSFGFVWVTAGICEVVANDPSESLAWLSLNKVVNTPKQPKFSESHYSKDCGERDTKGEWKCIWSMAMLTRADKALVVAIAHALSQRWGLFWFRTGPK